MRGQLRCLRQIPCFKVRCEPKGDEDVLLRRMPAEKQEMCVYNKEL